MICESDIFAINSSHFAAITITSAIATLQQLVSCNAGELFKACSSYHGMSTCSAAINSANANPLKLLAISAGHEDRYNTIRRVTDSYPPIAHFKSAQWSADGTCIVSNSSDNHIRTFVIPPELLEERFDPLQLEPYSEIVNHGPTDAVTLYPGFDLQDVASALVLFAVNDHPIRLHSALTTELVASYPLVKPTTETFLKPHSLEFAPGGTQFVAGSESLISIFDLSRPGQEPISSVATGPKHSKATWSNPGVSMRGIVSALTIDHQHNLLAAGTLTRQVGLYDAVGNGECVGVFSLHGANADAHIGGHGVTQLRWSACGKYLYIAERKSTGLLMYDIRNTGQLLGWLEGRAANSNQRLSFDIVPVGEGNRSGDIVAGGTDGFVQFWHNSFSHEGSIRPNESCRAHEDVVNSCGFHRSRTVLATASGQRHSPRFESSNEHSTTIPSGSCLKLWAYNDLDIQLDHRQ